MSLAFILCILPALPYAYPQWISHQKLRASDAAAEDWLGISVDIDSRYLAIGAPRDDPTGSVRIFRRNTAWSEVQKIVPTDGVDSYFGWSVAVSAATLVVGARYDNPNGNNSGSAYVFGRNGSAWQQQQKLVPTDGAAGHQYGTRVAVKDNVALVGARNADGNGACYVLGRSSSSGLWEQTQKLQSGVSGDQFGQTLALHSDLLAVGALADENNRGKVYLYTRSVEGSWVEQQILSPPRGLGGDFGVSIAISADATTIMVGARFDDEVGSDAGAVHVYQKTTDAISPYSPSQKLTASDGKANDWFAHDLALEGDVLVVSALGDDTIDTRSGAVYFFVRSGGTWQQGQKIVPPDGVFDGQFSRAVALLGNTTVVGAFRDGGDESGSAYVYVLPSWVAPTTASTSTSSASTTSATTSTTSTSTSRPTSTTTHTLGGERIGSFGVDRTTAPPTSATQLIVLLPSIVAAVLLGVCCTVLLCFALQRRRRGHQRGGGGGGAGGSRRRPATRAGSRNTSMRQRNSLPRPIGPLHVPPPANSMYVAAPAPINNHITMPVAGDDQSTYSQLELRRAAV